MEEALKEIWNASGITPITVIIGGFFALRWLWNRIREQIKIANDSVVKELKGLRIDLTGVQEKANLHNAFGQRLSRLEGIQEEKDRGRENPP